jgi:hypothetical protein
MRSSVEEGSTWLSVLPHDEISRILQADRCRSENPKVVK